LDPKSKRRPTFASAWAWVTLTTAYLSVVLTCLDSAGMFHGWRWLDLCSTSRQCIHVNEGCRKNAGHENSLKWITGHPDAWPSTRLIAFDQKLFGGQAWKHWKPKFQPLGAKTVLWISFGDRTRDHAANRVKQSEVNWTLEDMLGASSPPNCPVLEGVEFSAWFREQALPGRMVAQPAHRKVQLFELFVARFSSPTLFRSWSFQSIPGVKKFSSACAGGTQSGAFGETLMIPEYAAARYIYCQCN
jgi:hypothetical protein